MGLKIAPDVVLENAPVIIALHDCDHNILWANAAYREATGLSLAQIEGKKCYSVWGLSKTCRGCPVTTALETGARAESELTPENQDHWPDAQGCWLSKAAPVRDEHGRVVGVIEVAYNITERKRLEADLARHRERLEELVTERTAQLRQTAAELEGSNQQLRATEQQLRAANQHLEAGNQQLRATEQQLRAANEELRGSEAKYHSIVDNIGIGVALISPEMEILDLNRQLRDWLPDIDPGKRPLCYRCFHSPGRDAPCDDCPVRRTLQDGGVHEAMVGVSGDGNGRKRRLISSPIRDAAGNVVAVVELVEDVTKRLALEAQLQQSQRLEAIGQLAGGVAHDFNNLIMGIMNYVQLCRDGIDPDHPIREWLDEITREAQLSADLTRQLLGLARKQTISPKVLDLNDVVPTMLKLLRRLIGEDIHLAWLPGMDLWPVNVDPGQINQVLTNLCINARDAIGGVGRVSIDTTNVTLDRAFCASHSEAVPGDYVALTVSDTGCGMDTQTLERIFDPFFTTKEAGRGTGLGLATVYGIVKQNQGHIAVESGSGKGTTFRIYLPRSEGEWGPASAADKGEAAIGGTETILLVEDERSIRVTTDVYLSGLGYTVLSAEAPDEALRLVSEHPDEVELLVTDVVMPGMNGRDLADRLRQMHPAVRCLFISGYTANVIAHHGVLDVGVAFLSKPIAREALAGKIREILDA